MLNTITVFASGIDQLEKFANDLDRVSKRIHGRTFKVFVEPVPSQIRKPMSLGDAMSFASDLIRQHHLSVGLRPDVDGLGGGERQLVKSFVAKQAGLVRSRPSGGRQGNAGTLRQQGIQAFAQAQQILPGNRVLQVGQAALAGRKTFKL